MNHKIILDTLKNVLKSKKIKYKSLADEIGMSESGLKKLLTAKDISLNRLTQITNALGIALTDLIELANEEEIKNIKLTARQEKALLSSDILLRVLWRISVEQKSEEETIELEMITHKKLTSCLLKLENLDLIKTTRLGDIISIHKGLYRWSGDSKLIKKLNRDWSKVVLNKALREEDQSLHRLSFLRLTPESKELLYKKLNSLIDDFARVSQKEKIKYPNKILSPTSLMIASTSGGILD